MTNTEKIPYVSPVPELVFRAGFRLEVPEDGMYEVQVTFAQPGTYVLRARADDGALYHDQDVTDVTSLLP